jgi:hypothetical protein
LPDLKMRLKPRVSMTGRGLVHNKLFTNKG